jgi:hypothetical protein
MKQLIIAALVFVFASCDNPQEGKPLGEKQRYGDGTVKVMVIDSCEYVLHHVYLGNAITHKGNCKFCAKRK